MNRKPDITVTRIDPYAPQRVRRVDPGDSFTPKPLARDANPRVGALQPVFVEFPAGGAQYRWRLPDGSLSPWISPPADTTAIELRAGRALGSPSSNVSREIVYQQR